jgi:hypothetical protein
VVRALCWRDNLRRLAAALTELDARIRTPDVPAGIPFPSESEFLARIELLNLTTRFGDLDLSFVPAGTAGYDDLARGVETMMIRSIVVPVAGLQQAHRVSGHCARHPVTSCIGRCRPMR